MLNFNILTLFPEFFDSPLKISLAGRARQKGLVHFTFINPRDFSASLHRHVDDRPFGGGPGMLMQLSPLLGALESLPNTGPVLLTSPRGQMLNAELARNLSHNTQITLICGRYEGVDARLGKFLPLTEISICDAVLNGGETAALAIIEAVCRFLPAFLGSDESSSEESFTENLLEYPQYTRPENFRGERVPPVLLGGNHALITQWRRQKSLAETLQKRPDLLKKARLDKADAEYLGQLPRWRPGRNLSFCLCHYPVRLEEGRTGTSSLTNLDIHDIARISRSYGMGPFYVLLSLQEQREILENILRHWQMAADPKEHGDRIRALELICPVANFAELEKKSREFYGENPVFIASSAKWPDEKHGKQPLAPEEVRILCANKPVVLLLGTARGLDLKALALDCELLRPLRFLDENHLPVRAAAAIMADRILGDFY